MRIFNGEISNISLEEAMTEHGRNSKCFEDVMLEDRFNTIAGLIKDIKSHVPELAKDSSYIVNTSCSPYSTVAKQVTLLEKITESIDHTTEYRAFLDASRKLTVSMIADDTELLDTLREQEFYFVEDQRDIVEHVHQYQVDASQIVANDMLKWVGNICFEPTPIKFFSASKRYDEQRKMYVTNRGGFCGDMLEDIRYIELNTHKDAGLRDIFKTLSVLHHETVHDQGFQLGNIYKWHDDSKLGELYRDSRIWYLTGISNAIIPCGIRDAYRAQCIEQVAYQQQALFDQELEAVLYPETSIPKVACT